MNSQTGKKIDEQTDRQTYRQTNRETDKQIVLIQIDDLINRHAAREVVHRQMDKQTYGIYTHDKHADMFDKHSGGQALLLYNLVNG